MPLENMKSMLKKASEQKYGVGAFNILDYNSTKAVVSAAEKLNAPVIIQTSTKTVIYWGTKAIMNWVLELAGESIVPVALHLDHCKDISLIEDCINAGWTSVMIDASSKPFEENLSLSRQVIDMARPEDITVEVELGAIVGVEDDIHVKEQDSHLVNIEQALEMCNTLQPDCFAPAVGTAHGIYKGTPKIAYDLLEEITSKIDIPLALHGGTGLSVEVFKKCIALGCAKVNISTQLKYAFIDGFVSYHNAHNTEYNPLKELDSQFRALEDAVIENIKIFGSEGKA
ncbi:MAG: class II fructose-bisphosphate aldolase [Sedimentisphaerales bacterium]|nr:class II fructose-bisphosphate aldolase [Sedimentisphaerales bacterium]